MVDLARERAEFARQQQSQASTEIQVVGQPIPQDNTTIDTELNSLNTWKSNVDSQIQEAENAYNASQKLPGDAAQRHTITGPLSQTAALIQKRIDVLQAARNASTPEERQTIESNLQARNAGLAKWVDDPFHGGLETNRGAIGGGVLGMGDGRGVVVSTSVTEDIARNRQMGSEAGYVPTKATFDSRVSVFKPIENGGLFDIKTKATPFGLPEQKVTPQRQRESILQNQPAKYNNPAFVIQGQQQANNEALGEIAKQSKGASAGVKSIIPPIQYRELKGTNITARQYKDILSGKRKDPTLDMIAGSTKKTETIPKESRVSPDYASIFSTSPVPRPANLTQEQVNKLTPTQYQDYKKQFDNYNTFLNQENQKLKEQNRQQRIEVGAKNIAAKNETKQWLADVQKQGFKNISINTKEGSFTVPIEKAYREIIKAKDVVGFGALPSIPEGFSLAGSLSEPALIPEFRTISQDKSGKISDTFVSRPSIGDIKPNDPLSKALYGLEDLKSNNPLVQAGKGVYKELGGAAAGLVNLENQGFEFVSESITGVRHPTAQAYIPKTPQTSIISGPIEGIAKSVQTGKFEDFTQGVKGGYNEAVELAYKQGPIETGAGIAASLIGFEKAIPLRFAATKIITAEGPLTVSRSIALGYGGKGSKNLIGFAGTKPFVGTPKPELLQLEKLAVPGYLDRGAEISTIIPVSRNILFNDKAMDYLIKIGKVSPESVRRDRLIAEILDASKNAPKKTKPLDYTGGKLASAKETKGVYDFLRKQNKPLSGFPGLKGSRAAETQLTERTPKRSAVESDFDIDFGNNYSKAAQKQDEFVKSFTPEPTKAVEKVGFNVEIGQRGNPKFEVIPRPARKNKLKELLEGPSYYHGTTDASLRAISEQGFDLSKAGSGMGGKSGASRAVRKHGIEGVYLSKSPTYAANYAVKKGERGALAEVKLNRFPNILSFEEIPEGVRNQLYNEARISGKPRAGTRGYSSIIDFGKYQKSIINYAKNQGYKGVEKPVKVERGILETVVFDPNIVKSVKQIGKAEFAGYGIKEGTGRKLLNFVTDLDTGPEAQLTNNKAQVYGNKYPRGNVKIQGVKEKTLRFQYLAKGASIGSLQSRASLEAASIPKSQIDKILNGAELAVYPAGFRAQKDLADFYSYAIDDAAKFAKAGRLTEGANLSAKAKEFRELYPTIDFDELLKTPPKRARGQEPPSITESLTGKGARSGIGISTILSRPTAQANPTRKEETQISKLGRSSYGTIEKESQRQINDISKLFKRSTSSAKRGSSIPQFVKSPRGFTRPRQSPYEKQTSQSSVSVKNPIESLNFNPSFPSKPSDTNFNFPSRSVPNLPSRYNPIGSFPSLGSPGGKSPGLPFSPGSPGTPKSVPGYPAPGSPGYPTYPLRPLEFPPQEYPFGYPPLGGFRFNPALFNSFARDIGFTKKFYQTTYESSDPNIKYLEGFSKFQNVSRSPKIFGQLEAADRRAQQYYYTGRTGTRKSKKSKRK